MIYLIYGENAYVREHELRKIITSQGVEPERIDVGMVTMNMLADIVRGASLFATKRLVIIRGLSDNASLFTMLTEWAGEVSPDTTIVLIEQKLDKRTKAYKSLVKAATVITADSFSERDTRLAEEWLYASAKQYGVKLSVQQISAMVARSLVSGEKSNTRVVDQLQLIHAVRALEGVDVVTDEMITTVLPQPIADTVFDLLDIAARREMSRITALLTDLSRTEDGHGVLGLLYSQWSQLVAIATLGGSSQSIANELSIHPYVAKKLQETGKRFRHQELQVITQLAAELDTSTKLSQVAPWDAVHRFLYAIVSR